MNKKSYRILLTNDDGISAPGLAALYREIVSIAQVTIIAPEGEQSAVGHGVSIFRELYLRKVYRENELWGYALDGTPADCVKLGITKMMKEHPPHLVISGINRGQNTGNSIFYSGTVSAAVEARMFGIPAIAVSIAAGRGDIPYFDFAARFTRTLALKVLEHGLPEDVLLNVNIPNSPEEQIDGIAVTRQGKSMYVDIYKEVGEEEDRIILRNIGEELIPSNGGNELDDVALFNNKISITPLHYNLTYEPFCSTLEQWAKNLQNEIFSTQ